LVFTENRGFGFKTDPALVKVHRKMWPTIWMMRF